MLLFQSDLSFLPGIKPRPARHHFAFTTKSRLVQKGEGRRRREGGEGSWSRESLRSTNDVSTRRERKTREGSLFLSFLLLRSARNGDRFRGGTKCGAASFGNGVNILAARQSGRRRQCSRGGASSGLGRGEMTGRRRGGRSRREQHSRTFYVCFRDKRFTEYLDARQNEPREKQTAFFQTAYSPLYTRVYTTFSLSFSQKSRGGKRDNCSRIQTRGTYEGHANTLSCFFAATTRVCTVVLATSTAISAISAFRHYLLLPFLSSDSRQSRSASVRILFRASLERVFHCFSILASQTTVSFPTQGYPIKSPRVPSWKMNNSSHCGPRKMG